MKKIFVAIVLAAVSQSVLGFSILSYNIRYNNPNDGLDAWENRKEEVYSYVFSGKYDVIGLQEVQKNQLDFLQSKPNEYSVYGVGREDGKEKGEYCPVFYNKKKFELISSETRWLSETPFKPSKGWDADFERVVTIVKFREIKSGEFFYFFNTHWDHVGVKAREESALLITLWAQELKTECANIILVGDLNATVADKAVRSLDFMFKDACPSSKHSVSTFNGFEMKAKPNAHIDHVRHSHGGWKASHYKIRFPKTKAGRQLSDHFPVSATFAFKK
jgi:endonuclease/exonuclease/phosphatase family metal-dependent hydrolase